MRRAALAFLFLAAPLLPAEVRLPNLFTDHAVLQREKPVRIWGWARPGEHVSVAFHRQTVAGTADDFGQWQAWLQPEAAGGPYTLTVSGDSTATPLKRTDILMGDVWIASGQSNMEMPLRGFNPQTLVKDGEKEIAAANHPRIRLLLQKKRPAGVPLSDTDDTWTVCTPETARNFSAVAYFFGREISEKENVPVGLIDTTWGGTPAHAWISATGIANANLTSAVANGADVVNEQAHADEVQAVWDREDALDKAAGREPVKHPALINRKGAWGASVLYNGMIAPFTRYTIRGAIWYQGETDQAAGYAANYARVFPTLIQDWRRQWQQGDFPFFYVQLASYGLRVQEGWPVVKDAQRRTLSLVNTGMAVTLDVGLADNIHPPDKQTVGARLAASALGVAYGEKGEWASPTFVQGTPEAGGMRVWFSHADGLVLKGTGTDGGFEVAGADRKFVHAEARVQKVGDRETVYATAAGVPSPQFVRYGWSGVVTAYLYNSAGMPLGTFTSEP